MLILIELVTAVLGITLLYMEVIRNRFLNYATSIFLLGFVPLLCVYPVIARVAVGGAYTIRSDYDGIVSDPWVYICYQTLCLSVLIVSFATMRSRITDPPLPDWRAKFAPDHIELALLVGIVSLGVYLYVYSTGYTVEDLLWSSRFEYFDNPDYSPLAFVISTYLVAIAPIAILLAVQDKKKRVFLIAIILLLIFYGLLSKDRKWLINIVSAFFAFQYYRNGFSITLGHRAKVAIVVVIAALAFWQIGRSVIFTYLITGAGDVVYESQETAIRLLTRGDFPYFYNASITAIDMNLNEDFIIPLALLRRQLFFFLPADYSFGLKLEDISALFSDAIGGEDALRRGNMPPGFFGLFSISFGWFGGIVACLLLPLGLRALDRFIHRSRGIGSMVITAYLFSSMTLLLRGDDSSATYFIVSSFAMLFLIRLVFRARPGKALTPQPRQG